MRIAKRVLCRHWVHSYEEDTGTEKVFRPADHAFPPSRGRLELVLAPDGSARVKHPGATDRPARSRGRWTLEGDLLEIDTPKDATPRRVYQVVSSSARKLVVRATASPGSSG